MPRPPTARLYGLEALRGIAATAVVFYHVTRHMRQALPLPALSRITQCGHAGVDLFFVLSGFIILFVHGKDLGQPGRWTHYAGRRFNRVFPTYWIALALTILLALPGHHPPPHAGAMAWSALLLPSRNEPLLGVAWTLQYEVVFYLLFSVAILNRRIGTTVLGTWLGVILLEWSGVLDLASLAPPSLSGAANVEFFLGMAVAVWLRRGRIPAPAFCMAAGLILLLCTAVLEDIGLLNGYASGARLAYGIPSALLIAGVVMLEREGRLSVPGWLRRLGSGSYSIYLFQFVFIGIAWQMLRVTGLMRPGLTLGIFVLLAASAILGGLAISIFVEQPLLKRSRRSPQGEARKAQKALLLDPKPAGDIRPR